ncbi:hypothetical protein J7K86_03030, partial [bacterium]|nr:hypothetical protein [bacterium]
TTQKLKCLIKLFFLINQEYETTTIETVKLVNSKRMKSEALTEKDISDLLGEEEFLNELVSSFYYTRLVYERIIKRLQFFEEDKEIIEDLIIETEQSLNLCKISLKNISNIRDYYMISLSNKLNKIIAILTIFTIFLEVPAVISGIYGMNVKLPFQTKYWAFYFTFLPMGVIWLAFLIYFKRKKIL